MDKRYYKRRIPPKWSVLARKIAGRKVQGVEPRAGSWPMYFFKINTRGKVIDWRGKPITLQIKNPETVDFRGKELHIVQSTLNRLTKRQRKIAKYWSFGPPTKQWTPIVDRLIDTYRLSPPRAARVLGAVQAGINDSLVITWYLKYIWDVARPNQVDRKLKSIIATPRFPGYPSGHSTSSGCAQVILSYFFPTEAKRLKQLAEEDAVSRLYAGVHFPADNHEGLRLGRQLGRIIVSKLNKQRDSMEKRVDTPSLESRHAQLPPPPYKQVIPFSLRKRQR